MKRYTAHGMSKSPTYRTWEAMIGRCEYPSNASYPYYGAKGVTVCKRWRESFLAFYEDMGERPFPKAQLDRIDNSKGYSPENCRWVTRKQNMKNRKNRKEYKLGETSASAIEWERLLSLPDGSIRLRMRKGKSFEEALNAALARQKAICNESPYTLSHT